MQILCERALRRGHGFKNANGQGILWAGHCKLLGEEMLHPAKESERRGC